MTCKTMKQNENDQNHKKESTPVVDDKPNGKSQSNTTILGTDPFMKKMFGKFMRLSARPTGGESSNGLGLSIVKRLAERMSGTVRCESRLGQGATFVLE